MCDENNNQGLVRDPRLSRRDFGLMTAVVVGTAGATARAEETVIETDVAIKTPDGLADAVVFHPAGAGARPGVLLWPDIMSLRPVFRDMGRRLAAAGYLVLVPNLYYRTTKAPVVGEVFDFGDPRDRAKLDQLRASVTPEGTDRDAAAYVAFLDAHPTIDKSRPIGVQGYCMGGPLAFRTAAVVPDRVAAVASFHGAGLVTAAPSSPHLLIPKIRAEFLVDIADNDDKREPAAKDTLKTAFAAAGRSARVEVFPGANHGWTVKGSQVYNEAAAEKAWADLLGLYKKILG